MKGYNAVLFDVDGTLIHSQPGILHSFSHTFRQMGLDPAQIDLQRYLGPPLRWSFAQHFSNEEQVERAVNIYREFYACRGMHECEVYPGVTELLSALRAKGILICTATSKPKQVVEPILREKGLYDFFDLVGGASMDKSVDTKTAVIRQVLAAPQLAGRCCLMVGDRRDDMEGAANCGLDAAGVLYGYGSREELEAWQPVFLAAHCMDLLDFLFVN
ncbi:MAG: HAD-IA family hydrolase [Gemmiger sp.]